MKKWITKSNYTILKPLGGRSNVFLLQAGSCNILIDSGPAFMWRTLNSRLKKSGISKIDYLVLTHTHFDHAANAHKLQSLYHAKIIVHSSEAENLASGTNPVIAGTSFISKLVAGTGAKVEGLLKYKACEPDILTDRMYDFNSLAINAYILHTPGHTQGSQSLVIDDEFAITGDCMFGVFPDSAFPPFVANVETLMESWKNMLELPVTVFLPAHGSERTREQVIKTKNRIF